MTKASRGKMWGVACLYVVVSVVVMLGANEGGPVVYAQRDATEELLAELTNAPGASGFEGPVRDILKREWSSLVEDLRIDGLGNLLGTLPGESEQPRVLLMAHMVFLFVILMMLALCFLIRLVVISTKVF